MEWHDFCDASDAAVIYLWLITTYDIQVSLVISKSSFSHQMAHHSTSWIVWSLSLSTASISCQTSAQYFTIKLLLGLTVLSSLIGLMEAPGGSRHLSEIESQWVWSSFLPNRWHHVNRVDNPADCASRDFLCELPSLANMAQAVTCKLASSPY